MISGHGQVMTPDPSSVGTKRVFGNGWDVKIRREHGKTLGKPWENHGKTMGNTSQCNLFFLLLHGPLPYSAGAVLWSSRKAFFLFHGWVNSGWTHQPNESSFVIHIPLNLCTLLWKWTVPQSFEWCFVLRAIARNNGIWFTVPFHNENL